MSCFCYLNICFSINPFVFLVSFFCQHHNKNPTKNLMKDFCSSLKHSDLLPFWIVLKEIFLLSTNSKQYPVYIYGEKIRGGVFFNSSYWIKFTHTHTQGKKTVNKPWGYNINNVGGIKTSPFFCLSGLVVLCTILSPQKHQGLKILNMF